MAIVTTDDQHYTDIAAKIREKTEVIEGIAPKDMAEAVDKVYESGKMKGYAEEHAVKLSILDRSITEVTAESLVGLTLIGGYGFYGCKKLTSVALPEGLIYLNGASFQGCSALTSVKLPTTLEGIFASAFQGCTALTELVVPSSVVDISGSALKIGDSTNKATIIFLRTTPPTIQSSTFDTSKLEKILVPIMYGDAFCEATNWSILVDYIKEDWFYESNLTVDKNASFIDEGICNIARVHRYLVIEAGATSHTGEYITGGDKIATLEEFSFSGVGPVEYGGDISVGYNCIDLYDYYTEEELNDLIGVTDHSIGFTYMPDEYLIGAGGMDFRFKYGFSEERPE